MSLLVYFQADIISIGDLNVMFHAGRKDPDETTHFEDSQKVGCIVWGGKRSMGCFIRGGINCMGCFVRLG